MNFYVITYTERMQNFRVIWEGETANKAVNSFMKSFDLDDFDDVRDIKVYSCNLVSELG